MSEVFANTQAYLESGLLIAPPATLATDPLTPPAVPERNMLHFHAYFILYAIAPLVWLFPVAAVLNALFALSYLGIVLLSYLALRARGISIVAAMLFCLLVTTCPAWVIALEGQFYPDRLFVLAGFVFMLAVTRPGVARGWQLAAAAACVLIGERGALTAGLFLLAYTGLQWNALGSEERKFKATLGAGLLLISVLIGKLLISNGAYSTFLPTSVGGAIDYLHSAKFQYHAPLFIAANAVLLVLALFNWRAALVAGLLMLPNLIGNIGGGEKTGFATHYHTYYLPALVWAALTGYAALTARASAFGRAPVLYAGMGAAIVLLAMLDPTTPQPLTLNPARLSEQFIPRLFQDVSTYDSPGGLQLYDLGAQLDRTVPPGATVSTIETGMPFLYHGRTLRAFPVGIDQADYAVVGLGVEKDGKQQYNGALSFRGPAEQEQANAIIMARMRRDGYDFNHAVIVRGLGVAVVKRAH